MEVCSFRLGVKDFEFQILCRFSQILCEFSNVHMYVDSTRILPTSCNGATSYWFQYEWFKKKTHNPSPC